MSLLGAWFVVWEPESILAKQNFTGSKYNQNIIFHIQYDEAKILILLHLLTIALTIHILFHKNIDRQKQNT